MAAVCWNPRGCISTPSMQTKWLYKYVILYTLFQYDTINSTLVAYRNQCALTPLFTTNSANRHRRSNLTSVLMSFQSYDDVHFVSQVRYRKLRDGQE